MTAFCTNATPVNIAAAGQMTPERNCLVLSSVHDQRPVLVTMRVLDGATELCHAHKLWPTTKQRHLQ